MSSDNDFSLSKHKIKSLKDIVYEAISKNILAGEIQVGAWLKETELSEQLGISRGPIREALGLLEQDGFVHSEPNKGAIVTELSLDEVDEVYIPIRKIVERYALINSHDILQDEDYSYLSRIIDNLEEAYLDNNMEKVTEFDYEFHRHIVSKCASTTLKSIWYSLSARITRWIYSQTKIIELAENVVQQHRDLLDGIKVGDKEKLEELIHHHFI